MTRPLLATALLAVLLTSTAYAQDASSSAMMSSAMPQDSSMMSSAMPSDSSMMTESSMSSAPAMSSAMESSAMSSQMSTASSMESSMMSTPAPATAQGALSGYTTVDTDQLATKIIGQPVYDGTDANADNLGNISDLVVNKDGSIAAVVVGVGGFLGIGQKQVAVNFSSLQLTVAADNTKRFVIQTTKDELTSAPDFKTVDTTPSQAASDMSTSSMAVDQAMSSSSAM